MTKNGPEFLIGWRDFPLEKDDTWEPITNLTGSEHMICEFQKQHELDYTDRRKSMDEKNASTALDHTVTSRRHETTMEVTMQEDCRRW